MKVNISQQADYDNTWASFRRTSGLPLGYFDPPWYRRDWRALLVVVVVVVVCLL